MGDVAGSIGASVVHGARWDGGRGRTGLFSHPGPVPHSPWMFCGLSMTKFPFQTTDKLTGRSLMSFPS